MKDFQIVTFIAIIFFFTPFILGCTARIWWVIIKAGWRFARPSWEDKDGK